MDAKRLVGGVVGGLVGGVMFGILMQMMGMLGMVAQLIGQDGTATGWVVHLDISAVLGVGYALTFGQASTSWGRGLGLGAGYGVLWWVLGALLLMPAKMGMPVLAVGDMQLQSLMGHLICGPQREHREAFAAGATGGRSGATGESPAQGAVMPTLVDRDAVRRLLDGGAQLVDVLPPAEYAHAHLRGAVSIPLKTMTAEAVARLDRRRPVVAYCYDYQ